MLLSAVMFVKLYSISLVVSVSIASIALDEALGILSYSRDILAPITGFRAQRLTVLKNSVENSASMGIFDVHEVFLPQAVTRVTREA